MKGLKIFPAVSILLATLLDICVGIYTDYSPDDVLLCVWILLLSASGILVLLHKIHLKEVHLNKHELDRLEEILSPLTYLGFFYLLNYFVATDYANILLAFEHTCLCCMVSQAENLLVHRVAVLFAKKQE
ncbi:MAG: hypothetical protein LBN05_01005 [Oscillospiraceae bacterium]|jgi:hypothetical protein|nr:hypothetical protein [Oscillospiraceae bacterium]